jgi:transglycosylase-like protein with SLT domain
MRALGKPRRQAVCIGAIALCALAPSRARADQIVAVKDAQGHKVYINTGDPPQGFKRTGLATPKATPPEIQSLVEATSQRHQVDPSLVHAIIQVESDYNPKALSRKGAMGLMQLIPATADRYGVSNPFNAKQNIEGGVSYLKYLLNLFGGDLDLSLAAYNAGEHRVLRTNTVPDISETRSYVKKVERLYQPGSSVDPGSHAIAPKSAKTPPKAPIYRYVDSRGVVHLTNGDEL